MIKKIIQYILLLLFSILDNALAKDIGSRSRIASAMLDTIPVDQKYNLIYLNALILLDKDADIISLQIIKKEVLDRNKRYFIDFNDSHKIEQHSAAKKRLTSILGVGLGADF